MQILLDKDPAVLENNFFFCYHLTLEKDFIKTYLNPFYKRMFCAKFGGDWPN